MSKIDFILSNIDKLPAEIVKLAEAAGIKGVTSKYAAVIRSQAKAGKYEGRVGKRKSSEKQPAPKTNGTKPNGKVVEDVLGSLRIAIVKMGTDRVLTALESVEQAAANETDQFEALMSRLGTEQVRKVVSSIV